MSNPGGVPVTPNPVDVKGFIRKIKDFFTDDKWQNSPTGRYLKQSDYISYNHNEDEWMVTHSASGYIRSKVERVLEDESYAAARPSARIVVDRKIREIVQVLIESFPIATSVELAGEIFEREAFLKKIVKIFLRGDPEFYESTLRRGRRRGSMYEILERFLGLFEDA